MSRDVIGGAIAAAGVWAIFAASAMGFTPLMPRGHAWVVTGSEMIASHPDLVRVAYPSALASRPKVESDKDRLPEG